jgi:hypothetical protein
MPVAAIPEKSSSRYLLLPMRPFFDSPEIPSRIARNRLLPHNSRMMRTLPIPAIPYLPAAASSSRVR